ncbi:MAG: glycosyltransferase family 4 protein [Balneolaceae bacterium]
MKKIAQLRNNYIANGPTTLVLQTSLKLKEKGFEPLMISGGGEYVQEIESKGISHLTLPELSFSERSFGNVVKAVFGLKRIIEDERIDLIHAHNAAVFYIAYWASKITKRKCPVILTNHGVEYRPNYQWRNWIYKIFPSTIIAVSEYTKRILISLGVNEERVKVVYNGVDLNRFDISKKEKYSKEIRDEFEIDASSFLIGIVGNMNIKGHDNLIRAFSSISAKYPKVELLLVGNGVIYDECVKLANELKVSKRVHFAGFRTDVEKFHASFDLYTLPSKEGEMLPISILESMAFGNTFVASSLSGIPELVKNGEGLLVKPNDVNDLTEKLIYLLDNKDLREEMEICCLKSAREIYNIDSVMMKTIEIYQEG